VQEGLLLLLPIGWFSLSHDWMRLPSLIEIPIVALATLISYIIEFLLWLTLHGSLLISMISSAQYTTLHLLLVLHLGCIMDLLWQ